MENYDCKCCKLSFNKKKLYDMHLNSFQHSENEIKDKEMRMELKDKQERHKWETGTKNALTPKLEEYLNGIYETLETKQQNKEGEKAESFEGNLSGEIKNHYKINRPKKATQLKRKLICTFLKKVVTHLYPHAKLEVFGSIPIKLDNDKSDIDISLYVEENNRKVEINRLLGCEMLENIGRAIRCLKSKTLSASWILTARVPIVNISCTLTNIKIDLSLWMLNKLEINQVFEYYLKIEPRVLHVVWVLRCWSKERDINNAFNGKINSFAWTTMFISYSQMEGVVPNFKSMIERGIGLDYDSKEKREIPLPEWKSKDERDVGKLLIDFLQFLLDFDKKNKRISMRYDGITDKEESKFDDSTYFCVERPRTPYQNITRQVNEDTWNKIEYEIKRALKLISNGGSLKEMIFGK